MLKIRYLIIPFIFLLGFLFIAISLFGVEVEWVSGEVQYRHMNSDWDELDVGMMLYSGDIIKTGIDGEVSLNDNGTTIQILPNTKFTISEKMKDGEKKSAFMLFLGRIKFKLSKRKGNEPDIVTQAVNLTVRGTEFDVASGYDGSTLVLLKDGVVEVRGKTKEVVLNKGEGVEVKFGEEPANKFKLISKVIDWNKWFNSSKENIKGNEKPLLIKILKKFEEINEEISRYEEIRAKALEDKREYVRLRDKLIAEGKKQEAEEYSRKASLRGKLAFHSLISIRFLALSSIGLKDMADSIYNTIVSPEKEIIDIYKNIEKIYSDIEKRYIRKGDRERLEKRAKKKKGCLGIF